MITAQPFIPTWGQLFDDDWKWVDGCPISYVKATFPSLWIRKTFQMAWTLPQTIVGCMRKRNKNRLYSCRGIQQKTRKHIKGTSYWRDLESMQLWRQVSTVSRSLQTHILEKSRLKVTLVWFSLAFWGQCWLWSRRCWSSVFNTAVHEAGQSLTLPALAPVLGSFFSHSHILSPLILQFPWAISAQDHILPHGEL